MKYGMLMYSGKVGHVIVGSIATSLCNGQDPQSISYYQPVPVSKSLESMSTS